MLQWAYTAGLFIYYGFLKLTVPFHKRTSLFFDERKKQIPKNLDFENCILIHCASLGEYEMVEPLISELSKLRSRLVISFYSDSGYNNVDLHHLPKVKKVYYPLDFNKQIEPFFQELKPKLVIYVAYEYWFNSLKYLQKNQIPYIFLNTIFKNKPWFINDYIPYFERLFRSSAFISSRSVDDVAFLKQRGYSDVIYMRDLRYAKANLNAQKPFAGVPIIGQKKCIIYGSTWPKDEAILLRFIHHHPEILHVIAPHDVSNKNLERLIKSLKVKHIVKYSTYNPKDDCDVLIIDSIGHLKYLYQYGDLCYVGGGFSNALHNIIEPIAFKKNVIIGPNFSSYPEANMFIQEKIVYTISNYDEFEYTFNVLKENNFKIFPNKFKLGNLEDVKILANKIESIIVEV